LADIHRGSEVVRDFREWGFTTMGHMAAPFQRANRRTFAHRSCRRKVVHPTEEVAEAARRLTEVSTGDGPLHSYRCDFCAGWHVGHIAPQSWAPTNLTAWSDDETDRRDRNRRQHGQRRGRGRPWLDS
jgi:hypothetical protein